MSETVATTEVPVFQQTEKILSEISDEALSEITTLINLRRAINLAMYKDKYIKRRIAIRIRSTLCHDAGSYCYLLRTCEEEVDKLVKALTIHVSHFFRNPTMFENLRERILPQIFRTAQNSRLTQVSMFCMGCACGEEPYSLAILLYEYFADEIKLTPVCITAVDIDIGSIENARRAVYTEDRLREISPSMRKKYFIPTENHYHLIPDIKEMVHFQPADITGAAAYQPAELVMCRNTLIYFTRPDQEKILHNIVNILSGGGILVLGKSETLVGEARQKFETVSMEERIYRKKQLLN